MACWMGQRKKEDKGKKITKQLTTVVIPLFGTWEHNYCPLPNSHPMSITTSSPVPPSLSTSSPIKLTFRTSSSYPSSSPKPHPSRLLLHNHTLTLAASPLPFVLFPRCSIMPLAGSINEDAGPVPENHSPVSSARFSQGLILDFGKGNSWDSAEVGSPVVKRFLSDDGERWHMWYHGRSHGGTDSSPDCIGLAVSNDGIQWERRQGDASSGSDAGLVMSCGSDWWCFDTTSIHPGDVLVMSSSMVRGSGGSVYWMYYTGCSSETLNLDGDFELSSRGTELSLARSSYSGWSAVTELGREESQHEESRRRESVDDPVESREVSEEEHEQAERRRLRTREEEVRVGRCHLPRGRKGRGAEGGA